MVSGIDPSQAQEIELYNALVGFVCTALEFWGKITCGNYQASNQQKPPQFGTQQRKSSASSNKEEKAPTTYRESEREKQVVAPTKAVGTEKKRTSSLSYQTPIKDTIRVIDSNRQLSGGSVLDKFEHISTKSPIKYDEKLMKDPAITGASPKKKIPKPNIAKSILRLPQNHLTEKLNKAKEELKSSRRSYPHTTRTYSRPEDQQFAAEIAERAQVQEDTQNYKKIAREFRQMTTKLLIEEGKKVSPFSVRLKLIKILNRSKIRRN